MKHWTSAYAWDPASEERKAEENLRTSFLPEKLLNLAPLRIPFAIWYEEVPGAYTECLLVCLSLYNLFLSPMCSKTTFTKYKSFISLEKQK